MSLPYAHKSTKLIFPVGVDVPGDPRSLRSQIELPSVAQTRDLSHKAFSHGEGGPLAVDEVNETKTFLFIKTSSASFLGTFSIGEGFFVSLLQKYDRAFDNRQTHIVNPLHIRTVSNVLHGRVCPYKFGYILLLRQQTKALVFPNFLTLLPRNTLQIPLR